MTKAGQNGSIAAEYDLGYAYHQGQGVTRNLSEAAKWFRLAAEGGDPLAQFDYGQRCAAGIAVPKDPVEGLKWYLLAAAQGQQDSVGKVKDLEASLSSEQIAEARKRVAAFSPRRGAPDAVVP